MSTNALRCAIPTPLMVTRVPGKPVSNAESSGHRKSTKRMRNIHSMCRDMEWWEVNEIQIPGNKIEPQWPFLDTLEQFRPFLRYDVSFLPCQNLSCFTNLSSILRST